MDIFNDKLQKERRSPAVAFSEKWVAFGSDKRNFITEDPGGKVWMLVDFG